jgi:TRAP transporter TAXI family solute receptor
MTFSSRCVSNTQLCRVLAVVLAATVSACRERAAPAPVTVRIGTGSPSGTLFALGKALAAAYSERIPDVQASVKVIRGMEQSVDAIERGDVDLAFDDSETAYVAFQRGTSADPRPHAGLRAVAVLFPTVVQVAARRDANIRSIKDLRGKRIEVSGPYDSSIEQAARIVLESYGLDYHSVTPVFGSATAADSLRRGDIDAVILFVPLQYWLMREIADTVDVRLIPIEHDKIAAIQDRNHFLKSTAIPAGTYRGQDEDVLTLGEDILLVCRQNLAEGLVFALTKTLFEASEDLVRAHPAASAIDPERGPTGSIPLHPGAARYYRDRQLPK